MNNGFDFDVIIRSLPYLFRDGMVFTLKLTILSAIGGLFPRHYPGDDAAVQ